MISDVMATKLAFRVIANVCDAVATKGEIAVLFACALHETGFGKTVADRIVNHARAMAKGINRALTVLGDRPIVVPPAAPVELTRVLELGCVGEDVKRVQRELQLAADGIFGKVTRSATMAYQTQHQLVADGRIGPTTWDTLLTDNYVPASA